MSLLRVIKDYKAYIDGILEQEEVPRPEVEPRPDDAIHKWVIETRDLFFALFDYDPNEPQKRRFYWRGCIDYHDAARMVEQGTPLSNVLLVQGYDPCIVKIVSAGERGGILEKSLPHAVDRLISMRRAYIHQEVVAYDLLAELSEGGVPITEAFGLASDTIQDQDLRYAFRYVQDRVQHNSEMSEAMGERKDYFNEQTVFLVRMAEAELDAEPEIVPPRNIEELIGMAREILGQKDHFGEAFRQIAKLKREDMKYGL